MSIGWGGNMVLLKLKKGSHVVGTNDSLSDVDYLVIFNGEFKKELNDKTYDIEFLDLQTMQTTLYTKNRMYGLWHLVEVLCLTEEPIYEYKDGYYKEFKEFVLNTITPDVLFKFIKVCVVMTNYNEGSKRKTHFMRLAYALQKYLETGELNFKLTEEQARLLTSLKRKETWSEDEENYFNALMQEIKNYAPDLIIDKFFKERKQVGMLEKPLLENLFSN